MHSEEVEMAAPRQRVILRVADTAARHLELELQIDEVSRDPLVLRLPSWVPGSYLMREYAGQVVDLHAQADGRSLVVTKRDKSTWEITGAAGSTVSVRYRVFAPELTVRTTDLTPEHAFVHGPSVFFGVEGRTEEEIALRVQAPDGWITSTSLPERDGGFFATDYDHLLDCPLEIGPHEVHRFEVAGRPHEFVVHGSGNHDIGRILEDTRKIVEAELAFFGDPEPPYERYLFILHLTHDRGGGLEHADSCALAWPKLGFRPEKEYRAFLTLVAHEFFHVWNVKRIRPEVLLEYDYTREVYTRLLWLFEGWTTYYDEIIPVRAGCYGAREMLAALAEAATAEATRPGGRVQSLADSSFDTWIKLYRPNPDTPNTQTNYYLKGRLVAWKLDLYLRARSGSERSLDDVMRYLWNEVYRQGTGVPEDGVADLIERATGIDVREFLVAHVESAGALHYDDALASVGLRMQRKPLAAGDPVKAWLGATVQPEESGTRLLTVTHDSPAHRGGLMADDLVIALDGHRCGRDLTKRVELFTPGESVTWTAFRRDRLVQGDLTFTADPVGELEVVAVDAPTSDQKRAFAAWAGQDFATVFPIKAE